jgi:hypothetical protein
MLLTRVLVQAALKRSCFSGRNHLPQLRNQIVKLSSIPISSVTEQLSGNKTIGMDSEPKVTFPWHDKDYAPNLTKLYTKHFDGSKVDLLNAPTGAYVSVSPSDIEKYFPEGLAGEAAEEFEITQSNQWMVRDSGKFVCHLIDEYSIRKSNAAPVYKDMETEQIGAWYPGLTDRPEWYSTVMSVEYNGEELIKKKKPSLKAAGNMQVDRQRGDVVGNFLEKFKNGDVPEIPDRIMLVGTYCKMSFLVFSVCIYKTLFAESSFR